MFVDASAMVAIVALEPEHTNLVERLEDAVRPVTSPLAVFETVLALVRDKSIGLERARTLMDRFLQRLQIQVLSIEPAILDRALDAHARFGKGRGHPARLNFGDCFAYAMAKQHGVPLLYKGDDFSQTDLA
jgi:ribonuclease VapC